MERKNIIMKAVFGFLLFLISSFSTYAEISFSPLETIDEGNYELELVQENYLIYSNYMENRDNIKKNKYYLYDLNKKEKIELGEFSSKSIFLDRQGIPYYFEVIEPTKFSKNNLKNYIVNIGQFDFSSKKFKVLYNEEYKDFLGFETGYFKTTDKSYIFTVPNWQSLEFNNDSKLYVFESEFSTSFHLTQNNVSEISKQDAYNLKEKGFYFENDNFRIQNQILLKKDTDEIFNLKNNYNNYFCGIKNNIIYKGRTHYNFDSQQKRDILIEYDYILNKDINSSFVNGLCIRSNNFFLINNSLYNYNKDEIVNFEISKPISNLVDNTIIARDNQGLYLMSFSEFSVDYRSLNKFINESLKLYSYSNLDDLVFSFNTLENYYSKDIVSDNLEITQNIKNVKTELDKLRESCSKSNVNQNQNALCEGVRPYFDQIDKRYFMDLNIEILYIKPITENLFETEVYIELSNNKSINTTFKQEIKLTNNKYLISNLSKNFFFDNSENISLLLSDLNQNFSSYATTTSTTKQSTSQATTYNKNTQEESDEGNGFFRFIIFVLICASIYYGGKFLLNNIDKSRTLICPHCETQNEVKLSNNEIKNLKEKPLHAICHSCSKRINIDSTNISEDDIEGIKNYKKKAHLSSISDLENKLEKEYSKDYEEKEKVIEQKHIQEVRELEERKKELTKKKFAEEKEKIDLKYQNSLEAAKTKFDKEQEKRLRDEVKKLDENSQLVFKEKLKQEKQTKKEYEGFRDDLHQAHKGDVPIVKYVEYCFEKYGTEFDLKDLSNAINEIRGSVISVSMLQTLLDKLVKKQQKQKEIKKYTMADIDSMSGDRFEELLAELFKKLDYTNVKVTQGSHDGGTDLIAHKNSKKYIIQAKRYKLNTSIGVRAIQEIISCEREHKADKMMVITTAERYSNDAKRKAKENKVELWDRFKLMEILREVNLI